MNLPFWSSTVYTNDIEKKKIFENLSTFIVNVLEGNRSLKNKLGCYSDSYMVLEKQYSLGCWSHCLTALLGIGLSDNMHESSWLVAVLIAFIQTNDGDEEMLEPLLVCQAPSNPMEQFYLNELAQKTNEQKIQTNEKPIDRDILCPPRPAILEGSSPPKGSIAKLVQVISSNPFHTALSKIHCHRLLSSLNHPISSEGDIYLGGKHLQSTDISNEVELVAEFEKRRCNVIMFCAPLRKHGASVQHYTIAWMLKDRKEILYFDPKTGLDRGSDRRCIHGFLFPNTLLPPSPTAELLYKGDTRCAFYFDAPLDSNGCMDPLALQRITESINLRINHVFQNYFQIGSWENKDYVDLQRHIDQEAIFQTKLLSVKPSKLYSKFTGNSIGMAVYAKTGFPKAAIIGYFEGEIMVLTEQERANIISKNKTWQFYSIQLSMGPQAKERWRVQNGQSVVAGSEYTAYLSCYETAKNGKCLVSYANSRNHVYNEFGLDPHAPNAELKLAAGSDKPHLVAKLPISAGSEILWSYNALNLPKTIEEEEYSKLCSSRVRPLDWPLYLEDSRASVIHMLTMKNHPKYVQAQQFIVSAITDITSSTCQINRCGIELTNDHIARHRELPIDKVTGQVLKKLVSK